MEKTDFVSFQHLNSIMTDPKKDAEKKPIKWREIVWFQFKKENFFSFLYCKVRTPFVPMSQSENCSKLKTGRPSLLLSKEVFKTLYPTPLKIPYIKWENITQLLPFIPPIHHDFYLTMPHETKASKSSKKQNKTTVMVEVEENTEMDEDNESVVSDYDS